MLAILAVPLWIVFGYATATENDFATPACFEQFLTWIAEDDCGNIVRPAMLALRLVFGHGLAKSTDLGP